MSRQQSFPDDIWSTEPFASCSANAKYLYRWSRGNPSCGMAGIYRFRPRQAVLDTGLTSAMIDRALDELRERGMVYVVDGVLWNVERVADLYTKTRQIAVSIAKDVKALPDDHPLRLVFLAYYAERRCGFPRGVVQEALVEKLGAESIPASIEAVAIPALVTAAVPVALPQLPAAGKPANRREEVDAVWAHHLDHLRRIGRADHHLPRLEGVRDLIVAALRVATVDECKLAIDGLFADPWFRENDRLGIRYALHGRRDRRRTDREQIDDMIARAHRARDGGPRSLSEDEVQRLAAEAA